MSGSSSDEPFASHGRPTSSPASQSLGPEPLSIPPLPTPKATPSSILLLPHPLLSSRYHRQALLPAISIPGQTRISAAKILIIGLGGLGSPASLYLAALGVHTLGLVDGDTVELSNLHRQIVHSEASVGESKVRSAMRMLKGLNSEVRLVGFEERFKAANAKRIVHDWPSEGGGDGEGSAGNICPSGNPAGEVAREGWDIVLDCTDNPATRYLISDTCVLAGKVLVSGAAQRTEGQLMVLNYPPRATEEKSRQDEKKVEKEKLGTESDKGAEAGPKTMIEKGPCYRCIFPIPPAPETVQSCAEVGVLGPVVGVVGVLMALEVVKILVRLLASPASPAEENRRWKPSLLLYSALNPDPRAVWRSVGLRPRRKDCVACGDPALLNTTEMGSEAITWAALANGRLDYDAFCGTLPADITLLEPEHRVAPGQFIEAMEREEARDRVGRWNMRERPLVVDVREEVEFALGPKVKGSVNVPISRILNYRAGLGNKPGSGDGGGRGGGSQTGANGADEESEMEIEQLLGAGEATNKHPVYFVCQLGNDSQIAASRFLPTLGRNRWVGDVRGGFAAFERAGYV